ncbi:MAG TPA: hypothetical protein VFN10_02275 [Thermoanaerobaculia bacterium]|nr:hypothetical protein [Thermoanaerobaculia bacterium]
MEPLTPLQKRVVLALTILVGLTRFLAVAHSLWDWDEALFVLGVRDYDVTQHQPHPPGYPLFILAAKFFHLFGIPEYRSLQIVVLLSAMTLFPALVALARECGFDFWTSLCGATIFTFLPNVWVHGGTAFSDVPASALALLSSALLLRGRRDARAYLLGAIVLAIGAGVRPQNLVIGFVPAVLATIVRARESLRVVIVAIVLGAAIVIASYGGAVLASTTLSEYAGAIERQSQWVHDVDSYHSPIRPPLIDLAKMFFVKFVAQKRLTIALAALALLSIVISIATRNWRKLLPLAIFGPFAILAWLNLDFSCIGRYSVGYVAMHALLAADAMGVIAVYAGRYRVVAQTMMLLALMGPFVRWTWRGLTIQRTTDSPPAAAMRWIREHAAPDAPLFIHGGYRPHAEALLPGRAKQYFERDEDVATLHGGWVVDARSSGAAVTFRRERRPLAGIMRDRWFEVSVLPVSNLVRFGAGWYDRETDGERVWRWMMREGVATLPPVEGNGRFVLRFGVPLESLPHPPSIEVWFNGALLERFTPTAPDVEKSWLLPSRRGALNDLRITTSDVANPKKLGTSDDSRDLGLRLTYLSWTAATR